MKGQMKKREESRMPPKFLGLDDRVVVVPSPEIKKKEKVGQEYGLEQR